MKKKKNREESDETQSFHSSQLGRGVSGNLRQARTATSSFPLPSGGTKTPIRMYLNGFLRPEAANRPGPSVAPAEEEKKEDEEAREECLNPATLYKAETLALVMAATFVKFTLDRKASRSIGDGVSSPSSSSAVAAAVTVAAASATTRASPLSFPSPGSPPGDDPASPAPPSPGGTSP